VISCCGSQQSKIGRVMALGPVERGGHRMKLLLAALAVLWTTACLAQQPATSSQLPIFSIELNKVQWTKNPNTGPLEFAVLAGDPGKPGLYVQLVRWPAHTHLKAHSHPDDRYAVVLSGTFYHGYADRFDETKLEVRPAGTFFTEPRQVRHFGATRDEGAVLYFVGTGPSSVNDLEK
jgi:quercetin dioxygenase-like cupin family protein